MCVFFQTNKLRIKQILHEAVLIDQLAVLLFKPVDGMRNFEFEIIVPFDKRFMIMFFFKAMNKA